MKKYVLIILFATFWQTNAQTTKDSDIRIGIGFSQFGTGDLLMPQLEFEYNRSLNKYFTASGNLHFARYFERNKNDFGRGAYYSQANANVFFSPFTNLRKNDFRLGTGLSFIRVHQLDFNGANKFTNRYDLGANLIIEYTHTFSKKYLFGIKTFLQPYIKGDIDFGLMLKFGVKL